MTVLVLPLEGVLCLYFLPCIHQPHPYIKPVREPWKEDARDFTQRLVVGRVTLKCLHTWVDGLDENLLMGNDLENPGVKEPAALSKRYTESQKGGQ